MTTPNKPGRNKRRLVALTAWTLLIRLPLAAWTRLRRRRPAEPKAEARRP